MTENLKKFLEYISNNPEARAKAAAATEKEQIISIAAEHGFTLTDEDLVIPEEDQRIDIADLDPAAGGGSCGCVAVGGGASDHDTQIACGCVAGGLSQYISSTGIRTRCWCAAVGGGTDDW